MKKMFFIHSLLGLIINLSFLISFNGFSRDEKYSFPKGMFKGGGVLGYKDLTRQRRVMAKIPKGFNMCNKKSEHKSESRRDSIILFF
ncbi:MAG: hypothetical protein COZ80_01850 [Ignavibacteria bacterium CG_4_8_14_3_um_filter_37_9]|nr:MAG: hypothetical protein COZ80_01850 [Ignavibacteria bacterium CG_4_8_14_3_um_filter_37_9]PIX94263.1 MAG: hypothetical protein COZ25_06475 [Ignavibacteria bacterium CG_4_10_14_3_um_filter_37_18]PJC59023.1 MAG: hypothetical protein CO025_07455 [Ignavibacteria bacterium CG_4_9_14_0_2_um_filter_37_13]